jgi:hypothetical protein
LKAQPKDAGLLRIAHDTLLDGVLPALTGTSRYQTLMVARALAIAGREAELGPEAGRQEWLGLVPLIRGGMETTPVEATDLSSLLRRSRRALCVEIRNGSFDAPGPAREALLAHLALTTENHLKVSNPKVLAGT